MIEPPYYPIVYLRGFSELPLAADGGALVGTIRFGAPRRIQGNIRITVTGWNAPPDGGGWARLSPPAPAAGGGCAQG